MRKYSKLLTFLSVLLISALFCFTGPSNEASAQIYKEDLPDREGLEIENYFILHSALRTEIVFDSNIFLANRNKKHDTITLLSPSAGIEFPMGDNRLSVEYEPTFAFFNRHSEQDYTNHWLRALLQLEFTHFDITVDDIYRRWTNRAGSDELGQAGRKTREEANELEFSIGKEFDQLEYRAAYRNRMRRFLSKDERLFRVMEYDDKNHMYNEGDLEVGYRLFPKTIVLGEVVGGYLDFPSDFVPSSWYIETLLGFKGEWFGKLVFNVRGGVKYQDYGSSKLVLNEDYVDFVARGGIDYNMTDDDIFRLNFIRTNRDSIYRDMNYYTTNFASLDYTHRFTDKILANVFGSWQLIEYPHTSTEDGVTAKRWDNIYRLGPLLRYDINKWMSLETRYEYSIKDSKFHGFNYQDHRFTFRVTAGF